MAKKETKQQGLTQEQLEILERVMEDPFLFATFIYVIHPVRGKVKFDLYSYQTSVLWQFINEPYNIILKFRQAGITELISLFCLWLAMYHPNQNIIIISLKERVAKKVLRKIKYMYKNLPEFLKVPVINGRGADLGTAMEMEFENGSIIASIPTTEDAGRSEGLSLLVIDEAAIIRWANTIWAACWPTLSTGGRAIINSTPYGVGNFFHSLWVGACAGGNPFNPIRLRWTMHPERDISWYNAQRQVLGPRRTAQEIDGDFLTSGNSVFDLLDIRAIEDELDSFELLNLKKYAIFSKIKTYNGNLRIYTLPVPGYKYFIGADIATGRARDYSAFTIMDRYGEEVACFKGQVPVNEFANMLIELGKIYNKALIAPESNDIGLAVASKIQEKGYSNLYYSVKLLKEKKEKKLKEEKIPGWYTTKKNRPVIIGLLEEDIRLSNIICKDPFFVQEAYTFIYDEENKPIAMGKNKKSGAGGDDGEDDNTYTDDSIMAKAIANFIRKGKILGPSVLPR
jgi:hypothetical protein